MSIPYAVDFVGSISGTTLTVTSVATGTLVIQQIIFSTNPAVVIEPNTRITAGSGLSWTVNVSQTVTSSQLFTVYDPAIVISGSVESEYTIATPIPTVTFTSAGPYFPNEIVTTPLYQFSGTFGSLTGNDVTLTIPSTYSGGGNLLIDDAILYNNEYEGPDTINTFTAGEIFEFTIPQSTGVYTSAFIQFSDQQYLGGNSEDNAYWAIDGFEFVPSYVEDSIRYTTLAGGTTQSLELVTARVGSATGNGSIITYVLDSPVDVVRFGLTVTITGFTTFPAANVTNAVPTQVDDNSFSIPSDAVGTQTLTSPRGLVKFKILEQTITKMKLYGSFSWLSQLSSNITFRIRAPDRRLALTASTPVFVVGPDASPEILPFISGSGSTQLAFGSPTGFQTAPYTGLSFTVFQQLFDGTILNRVEYTDINVNPITITSVPALPGSLTINQYVPFSYLFSIPDTLVNVILQSSTTANLAPYLASDLSQFSSDTGFTSALTGVLELDALLNGVTSIANLTSTVTVPALAITITPPIPTGTLNLYKYEPFGPYTFTIASGTAGLTLQFTRSSSELRAFLSLADQTVTFAGTFNISYSAPLSLIVDVLFGTTVISTQTISVTVGPGRFFPPAANQNFQLFQYENVSNTFGSNPAFLTALAVDTILSSPGLPTGLSFGGSGNAFFLQGKPALQTAQSNYQVIGSNSTNGKIVTVTVSLIVNPQTVRITPSFATLSELTVDTPTTPVTFTALIPETIYAFLFRYAWSGLPDGFSFQDGDGNTVVNNAIRPDPGPTPILVLVGTPTLEFATAMSTGGNLYQTRLTASVLDQTGRQITGSALISFSFAETVLISVAANELLYQSKLLGTTDFVITTGSFFSSATIASVTVDSLPPGLSLVQVTATTYRLAGTPTVVDLSGSYTFTATNTNGLSRSITQTIAINPDVVTFGGNTPADGSAINFVVSRSPVSPIQFTATSVVGAAALPIVYSSSIDFTLYSLALNPSTGSLTGTPTIPFSQATVTISATDALGTVGTTTILFTIDADVFTFPTYTPTYFQNRPIIPFQFVMVSTLSGRPIQSYSSTDLPTGLVLNPAGILSGTTTVSTSGTFNITATTGYSTLSQLYSYTIVPDLLLVLQEGGSTAVSSTVFSNVKFQTVDYATSAYVNPIYTITDLYPPQPEPIPTISVAPDGTMTGDFRDGLVAFYTATLNASYNGAPGSTPVVFSFTPITVPVLAAVYNRISDPTAAIAQNLGGVVKNTTSYVFPGPTTQTWGNSQSLALYTDGAPYEYYYQMPDISRLGSNYVATGSAYTISDQYGVWSGEYSSTTSNIAWTSEILEGGILGGSYPAVTNDGVNKWVVVSLPAYEPRSNSGIWTRTGNTPGTWTKVTTIVTTVPTVAYMSPNFVIGNSGLGQDSYGTYNSYSTRIQYANSSTLETWITSTTLPAFSNITRFATSNTILVAVGNGAAAGVFPLAYSSDSASNWTTVTTSVGRLTGSAVVLNDILYGNGEWVLCGIDSNSASFIAYSTDLSNWSFYTAAGLSSIAWSSIGYNGNAWTLAGSSNGTVGSAYVSKSCLLSLDAGTWPTQSYSVDYGTLFSNSDSVKNTQYKISRLAAGIYPVASSTGSVYIPNEISSLTFTQPSMSNFNLFQYVPYSIPIQATGTASFIYYFIPELPVGFSFIPDPTGTTAALTGISPSNNTNSTVTVYAKTVGGYPAVTRISLKTVIPYFVNPQSGAGAYTEQLRIAVEANAAQNARDSTVFPEVNPLAGPFMGPRAPDVVTLLDCVQKLCKKPCPNCHTMM